MDVYELMSENEWTKRLGELYEQTGLAMSLTDPDGKIILSVGKRNPLCNCIREKEETLVCFCSKTNVSMTNVLKKTAEPTGSYCEAGLIRIAIPIVKEGTIIGQITGCGLKGDPDEIDLFYLSQELDLSETQLMRLVKGLRSNPEFSIEALKSSLVANGTKSLG